MSKILSNYIGSKETTYYVPQHRRQRSRALVDGKRADNNIFYCMKCDYCWEYVSKRIKKNSTYFTYKHFPTFKKERILCPKHHK